MRMALGAESRDILRIVFRRVGVQLASGLTAGVAIAYAVSGPLRFVMFGVETTDVRVYAVVVLTRRAVSSPRPSRLPPTSPKAESTSPTRPGCRSAPAPPAWPIPA